MSTKKTIIITPNQCRAARGFLNWSQEDLATKIKGSKKTITDFERENRTPQRRTMEDVVTAFLEAGIEFEDNDKRFCLILNK